MASQEIVHSRQQHIWGMYSNVSILMVPLVGRMVGEPHHPHHRLAVLKRDVLISVQAFSQTFVVHDCRCSAICGTQHSAAYEGLLQQMTSSHGSVRTSACMTGVARHLTDFEETPTVVS